MKHPIKQLVGACCLLGALVLGGCAAGSGAGGRSGWAGAGGAVAQGRDYFPGGSRDYAWGGGGQSKESLVNMSRAQYEYSPSTTNRHWIDAQVSRIASATMIGLQAYYPLHVRWKLKDGREFIVENIDISSIMREYFKTHDIQMAWRREGRPKDSVGDFEPLLTHEVKDDTVRIKWVIIDPKPKNLNQAAYLTVSC
jgi:hypothetical protein